MAEENAPETKSGQSLPERPKEPNAEGAEGAGPSKNALKKAQKDKEKVGTSTIKMPGTC